MMKGIPDDAVPTLFCELRHDERKDATDALLDHLGLQLMVYRAAWCDPRYYFKPIERKSP